MKCIALAGDPDLRLRVIELLAELPDIVVGTLESGDRGVTVRYPGMTGPEVLRTFQPDVLIVQEEEGLAVPSVLCGEDGEPGPLTIAGFTSESSSEEISLILERCFTLLPQKTSEECGKCGMDCRVLAERVVAGLSTIAECRELPAPGGVEIRCDGIELKLGEFPAEIVKGTVRGLLSSMKGYRPEASVSVELGPDDHGA